jgi:hypothetical protein
LAVLNFCGFWFEPSFPSNRRDFAISDYMHHRSRNFTQEESARREGEKTENEILLFFNLKSRFGKEQEREQSIGSA